jgi:two-component system, OmpR family, sensor histidine kinase BaeS
VRRSLLLYAFLAIVAVSLASVGLAGLITRTEASTAFSSYLETLPRPGGGGMGAGRQMMMGGAEQTFLASVDKGILIGVLISVTLAALVAFGIAYYLTRPLKRLTAAARTVADGDLTHRVEPAGPLEVRRLGDAFNEMADSLAESEELRRRLVADVAHELRTPVASLRAQAEGIAEGVLPADPDRLTSLADDTRQLSRLVDDLQELSAADAGRLSYRMGPTNLGEVARAECARATARAGEGVEVACKCSDSVPVVGDEDRLAQVLRNLLDNALRHTDEGGVTVRCSTSEGHAVVEVIDTGEGIPQADLPYVFERFYRADTARARDTGGSGIGLALSRRVVEDHGGEVFARNREEGGAVVGFSIPLSHDGR